MGNNPRVEIVYGGTAGDLAKLMHRHQVTRSTDAVCGPIDECHRNDLLRCVWAAIRSLDERQRAVLVARIFGEESLSQIGKRLGVSRERVRQIEKKAISRLRRAAALPPLIYYCGET